ncbi:hypothetical protein BOX15_Mlig032484g2, partial [Macrostomum lignano]
DKSRKKLVCASSLDQLRLKGCEKLGIADADNVRIVTKDGFEIDDDDLIPEIAKEAKFVYFLLQGELLDCVSKPSNETPFMPSTPARQQDSSSELVGSTGVSMPGGAAAGSLPWPEVYTLPRMGELSDALRELRLNPEKGAEFKVNPTFVNRFLKFIIEDVFQQFKSEDNPYLSGVEIRDICCAIIATYSGLRDDSPEGFRFWRIKICRRLKDLRSRKLTSFTSPIVLQMRGKHGRKRKVTAAAAACAPTGDTSADELGDDGVDEPIDDSGDDEQPPFEHRPVEPDCRSVMNKSVDFENDGTVPPSHEQRRERLNSDFGRVSISEVLDEMRVLFPVRISRCQDKTVAEEVELYRPLTLLPVILQETHLMIEEYNKSKTDYICASGPNEIRTNITAALMKIYNNRKHLKNYKFCKKYVDAVDSDDEKLCAAVCLLLGRLKIDAEKIFCDGLPVRIVRDENSKWSGVSVNGATLVFDNAADTVIVFIIVYVAFNLQHVPFLEPFLETIEVLAKLRSRSAVSRSSAKTVIASFL